MERAYNYGNVSYYDKYMTGGSLAYESIPKERVKEKKVARKKESLLDNPKQVAILCFAIMVIGIFVVLSRTAIISNMTSQISAWENKLCMMCSQNEQKSVALDKTTDLKYVEQVARENLNMDVPVAEQKVYVDVDIPDLVEVPEKTTGKIGQAFKKFLGGCMEYLY